MSNAKPEPFGYFHALPFGWEQCSEHDEGAVALYEHPPTATDDRIAVLEIEHGVFFERWHAERRQREALQAEVARLAAPTAAPYYISGPMADGEWAMCDTDTGLVVQRTATQLAGENAVLLALLAQALPHFEEWCADMPSDEQALPQMQALRAGIRAALAREQGALL